MEPKLIILRGNSGSGKSTVAKQLREQATTKTALVEQDYLRRIILREKGVHPNGDNIDLIFQTVTFAIDRGYNVILEGMLTFEIYKDMFLKLNERYHPLYYYFDISFEETLRRHDTKQDPSLKFGEKEMRDWYKKMDVTNFENEKIIPEGSSQSATVERIRAETNI